MTAKTAKTAAKRRPPPIVVGSPLTLACRRIEAAQEDLLAAMAQRDAARREVERLKGELAATARALEAAEAAHRAHEAGEHALTRRAEKAEKALDCGQAGSVCGVAAPGCLRHNLEHQRDLVEEVEEVVAKLRATVIERDEYDARLMVAEMAQTALVEALERFVTHWSPYEITLTPGDVKKGWEALEMVNRPSITPCSVDCGACNGDPAKAKEGKP